MKLTVRKSNLMVKLLSTLVVLFVFPTLDLFLIYPKNFFLIIIILMVCTPLAFLFLQKSTCSIKQGRFQVYGILLCAGCLLAGIIVMQYTLNENTIFILKICMWSSALIASTAFMLENWSPAIAFYLGCIGGLYRIQWDFCALDAISLSLIHSLSDYLVTRSVVVVICGLLSMCIWDFFLKKSLK